MLLLVMLLLRPLSEGDTANSPVVPTAAAAEAILAAEYALAGYTWATGEE